MATIEQGTHIRLKLVDLQTHAAMAGGAKGQHVHMREREGGEDVPVYAQARFAAGVWPRSLDEGVCVTIDVRTKQRLHVLSQPLPRGQGAVLLFRG